jgi:hypothetical protein
MKLRVKKEERTATAATKRLGWLIIVVSVVGGGYLWMQDLNRFQNRQIAYLEGLESRLKSETAPLKFMIESREGGEVKAKLKLYDLSGRELSSMEKSWPGTKLYVDMLLFPVRADSASGPADSYLSFPYRVFTDQLPAASGTMLFDSYDSAGFPEVFRGVRWSPKEEATIKSAFASARRRAASGLPAAGDVKGSFGSAVHEVSSLASLEEGLVYKVICRVKGGVEIMEDR